MDNMRRQVPFQVTACDHLSRLGKSAILREISISKKKPNRADFALFIPSTPASLISIRININFYLCLAVDSLFCRCCSCFGKKCFKQTKKFFRNVRALEKFLRCVSAFRNYQSHYLSRARELKKAEFFRVRFGCVRKIIYHQHST